MAKKSSTIRHQYDPEVESYLTSMYQQEVQAGKDNMQAGNDQFDQVVSMFEGERVVKDYDWYSNLSLKEGTSILLTDASTAVNQYFQSRDFVEVVLEGDEGDLKKCKAAKKAINKTLNNRRLYHYMKFTRAKNVNNMASHVYALCQWKQNIVRNEVGRDWMWQPDGVDEFGTIKWIKADNGPIYDEIIKEDRFDYEIFDPRNVFTSDEYVYNVQQKKWIILRSEMSYDDIKAQASANGYINLDAVKELTSPAVTETAQATKKNTPPPKKSPIQTLDVYTRFGKVWAIVEERLDGDLPIKIKPGYDKEGNVSEDAELVEAIISFAVSGSNSVLIRFDATPFIDSRGIPYRPIVRGICYPHPTKDTGLGEGELLLDLDAALNDAFNLSFDTAKLKTIPVMVTEKFAAEDNDSIFIEPGHNIAIEGGKKAIEMLEIRNTLADMLNMLGLVKTHTDQVTATYPNTMGNVAGIAASTTATAIAGAETRQNIRQNYKSITFEYTFLVDFYWIMLQMIWRFAHPQTALQLMGEDVFAFDPDADYTYTPVSSAIETEYNKFRKIQTLQQVGAMIAPIPNPNTPKLLNIIIDMIFETLGPDYIRLQKANFDEGPQGQAGAMQGGGASGSQAAMTPGTSNQNGMPILPQEAGARQAQYPSRVMLNR